MPTVPGLGSYEWEAQSARNQQWIGMVGSFAGLSLTPLPRLTLEWSVRLGDRIICESCSLRAYSFFSEIERNKSHRPPFPDQKTNRDWTGKKSN